VAFAKDEILVEFRGRAYQLAEIDGMSAEEALRICRERCEDDAEHTFAGLLGEMFADMGRKPGEAVSLVLLDRGTGEVVRVEDCPCGGRIASQS
jgi:hypothetical protein